MVWQEPRRIVAGASHGRNAHVVLVTIARSVELPAAGHRMALRRPAIGRFGVELGPNGLGIEPTEVDVDAEVVSAFLRRHAECAEARVGPGPGDIARPADELPAGRSLVGGPGPHARRPRA